MKRIGVLTSGGDSPGMNAAIRAVVRTAAHHGVETMGIERGYQGLIDGQLQAVGPRGVGGIIRDGGTILRSARCQAFYEKECRAQAAAQLSRHGVEGLVVIGGEGTYQGAQCLHDEHGIKVIGLPGTIDNDVGGTDFTIGYDTAVNTAMEAIDRVRDTAVAHDRLFFVEVMGRHSGYLAMMSGIAGGAEEVVVPEEPTDIEEIVERLNAARAKGKLSAIVVVAEGDDAGDAIEVAKKVSEVSNYDKYRVVVIGHLQRGGRPTAFDRILASRLGYAAVRALLDGESGVMAAIQRNEVVLRPLAEGWEQRTQFDPCFLELAHVLAT